MEIVFQAFGWIGAAGLLTAFYLNSINKLTTQNPIYHWLNFGCAVLLTVNAFSINSYPFVIINIFWALVALSSILRKKKPSKK